MWAGVSLKQAASLHGLFTVFEFIHLCVDSELRITAKNKSGAEKQNKNKKPRGDIKGSSVYLRGKKRVWLRGGALPRPLCLETNMNLFSKKYLQSHVHVHLQGEAQIIDSTPAPSVDTLVTLNFRSVTGPLYTCLLTHASRIRISVGREQFRWIKAELSCVIYLQNETGLVLLPFFCR